METITSAFTPPTTSLYQFVALSGLVFVLFFQYLIFSLYKFTNGKSADARLARASALKLSKRTLASFEVSQQKLNESDESLKKNTQEIDALKKKFFANPNDPSIKDEIERLTEKTPKLKELSDAARKEANVTSSLYIEAEHEKILFDDKIEEYKNSLSLLRFFYFLCAILTGISIVFAGIGFYFWDTKIQVYQDAVLKWQAEHPSPPKESTPK